MKESLSSPRAWHSRCAHGCCTETISCALEGMRSILNVRNLGCLREGRDTFIKPHRRCVPYKGSTSDVSEGQEREPWVTQKQETVDEKQDGGAQGSGWSLSGRAEAIPGRPAA